MLEWILTDRDMLTTIGGALAVIVISFVAAARGIMKGKKLAPETPLPAAPNSLDLARMEAFLVREFASIRHDMERIEGRQSAANSRVLDLLTRIDDRTK